MQLPYLAARRDSATYFIIGHCVYVIGVAMYAAGIYCWLKSVVAASVPPGNNTLTSSTFAAVTSSPGTTGAQTDDVPMTIAVPTSAMTEQSGIKLQGVEQKAVTGMRAVSMVVLLTSATLHFCFRCHRCPNKCLKPAKMSCFVGGALVLFNELLLIALDIYNHPAGDTQSDPNDTALLCLIASPFLALGGLVITFCFPVPTSYIHLNGHVPRATGDDISDDDNGGADGDGQNRGN